MASFLDRFRDPEKIKLREEARVQKEAADAAAREAAADQRQREQEADRVREEERVARSEWTYNEIVDEMRGTTTSMAQLVSENSIDFAFPYNGGCKGMLAIRKRASQYEALFTVTNGQLDGVIGDYTISAKVDHQAVQQWTGIQPDQGSSTLMFITNPVGFTRSFQKGDRLTIEALFYQHGPAQFKFNVTGLDARFRVP